MPNEHHMSYCDSPEGHEGICFAAEDRHPSAPVSAVTDALARRQPPTKTQRHLLEVSGQARIALDEAFTALDEAESLAAHAGVEVYLLAPLIQAKADAMRDLLAAYVIELHKAKDEAIRDADARRETGR